MQLLLSLALNLVLVGFLGHIVAAVSPDHASIKKNVVIAQKVLTLGINSDIVNPILGVSYPRAIHTHNHYGIQVYTSVECQKLGNHVYDHAGHAVTVDFIPTKPDDKYR